MTHAPTRLVAGWQHRQGSGETLACGCAELFGPLKQLLIGNDLPRLHIKLDNPLVTDFAGPEILSKKIERRNLIPRRADRLFDSQSFKTVLEQLDFARSVVGKRRGNRRDTDGLVVHKGGCPSRIAADREPPPHTSRAHDQYRENEEEGPIDGQSWIRLRTEHAENQRRRMNLAREYRAALTAKPGQ